MTTESNIKEKIEYEKGKCQKLEQKITKAGGRFNVPLVNLDANLKIIKDLLFEKGLIEKDEYELKYFKKVQILLENILEQIKKIKKETGKIIVPKAVPPNDLKKVNA